ncbi:hypothetical protein [Caulobacter phage KSC]|uniref:DUF3310 domain-containing protein n=1 Tax=Caulobacter phage KSC TaxID=3020398 RepID=A0AAF0BAU7_9CAUD|nr:hypothetical protein [Caulobacter phage KSC]
MCAACDHIDRRREHDDPKNLPSTCVSCLGTSKKPNFIPRDPWKPPTQRPETEEVVQDIKTDAAPTSALATQVGGDHYKRFAIQPVEFVHQNGLSFIVGSIIKYICRYKFKAGKQDLEKARHFLDMLIEQEYPQ